VLPVERHELLDNTCHVAGALCFIRRLAETEHQRVLVIAPQQSQELRDAARGIVHVQVPDGDVASEEGLQGAVTQFRPRLVEQNGYRVTRHYRIGTRTLELIHLETERAFVQGTLEDGDLVVIGGIHKVVLGQIVAINGSIVVLAAIRANPAARSGEAGAIADVTIASTRHILSTTFTTVGGFLPLALGGGAFWPPLAVVIGGGVALSTTLALVFTPAAYGLIARANRRLLPEKSTRSGLKLPGAGRRLPTRAVA